MMLRPKKEQASVQGQAPRPDAPNIVCKIRPRQTLSWTRTCLSQTGSGCCLMFTWAHRPRIGLPLPSDPTRPDLAPARAALACGVQPSGSTLCGGILDVLCTDRPVWSKGFPTMLDFFLRPPARPPAHSHRHPPRAPFLTYAAMPAPPARKLSKSG